MNCTKSFNGSSKQEADDCYCSGDFKMTVTFPSPMAMDKNSSNDSGAKATIFDQPDFVIDAYLDAKNGVSKKDEGIRCLSTKYCENEGNFNCNHNPNADEGCTTCKPSKIDPKKICCEKEKPEKCPNCVESIYEVGETAFVEFPKKHCCTGDENPYEEGESPFEEKPKKHICANRCNDDQGSPYELGAAPYKKNAPCELQPPCPEEPEKAPEQCEKCNRNNFTTTCSGTPFSEFEMEGEEGALVVSNMANLSNNNLQCSLESVALPTVLETSDVPAMHEDEDLKRSTQFEVLDDETLALDDELSFQAKDKSDDVRSCALC